MTRAFPSGAVVRRAALASLVVLVSAAPAAAQPYAQRYTVTAVGALAGNVNTSAALGIGPAGQVVGLTEGTGIGREAYATGAGGAVRLGFLPGSSMPGSSEAYGINASGQVVGSASNAVVIEAFITGPNASGGLIPLGFLPGAAPGATSVATAINASGQVVGYGTDAQGRQQAFIGGIGGLTGLGFFASAPGGFTQALGINDAGVAVGFGATGSGYQAFMSGANGLVGLGYLPGVGGQGAFSIAYAINAAGRIVGASTNAGGVFEAFITGPNGSGGLVGLGSASQAFGINAAGQVVGSLGVGDVRQGFVTAPGATGGLSALSALVDDGWVITDAVAINDAGQIAANGYNPAFLRGLPQGLLLTPVPEPSEVMLVGAGVLALGAAARRRRTRARDPR